MSRTPRHQPWAKAPKGPVRGGSPPRWPAGARRGRRLAQRHQPLYQTRLQSWRQPRRGVTISSKQQECSAVRVPELLRHSNAGRLPPRHTGSQQTARQRPRDDVVHRDLPLTPPSHGRSTRRPGPSTPWPRPTTTNHEHSRRCTDPPALPDLIRPPSQPDHVREVAGQHGVTDFFLSRGGVDVFSGA
jgi:hypothetical protein